MCPRWDRERNELRTALGCYLSYPNIIGAILGNRESWSSFIRFAGSVMQTKEAAESEGVGGFGDPRG